MTLNMMGELIRRYRRLHRLRQRDVAELAGVTLRGLTDLENGRGNPTINQLTKIADVLGLEITMHQRGDHAAS